MTKFSDRLYLLELYPPIRDFVENERYYDPKTIQDDTDKKS